jgi:hypothetical protein
MGYTVAYFYSLTPREFFNAYEGYRRKDREVWERFRAQYYATIAPHWDKQKNGEISIQKVWPLPWDKVEEPHHFEAADPEIEKQRILDDLALWDAHDKKQAEKAKLN